MKAELVLRSPDRQETFPLIGERVTIGRSIHTHVRLLDKLASREHCEIVRLGDRYILRDLGSSNGTIVNGKPVAERVLEWGDKIQVGETVLVFLVDRPQPDGGTEVVVTPASTPETESLFLRISEIDFRDAVAGPGGTDLPRLLYDAVRDLTAKETVPQACAALLRLILRSGRFGRAAVVLFDAAGGVVERFTKSGPDARAHGIQLEAGILRRVFEERESFQRRGETVGEMRFSSVIVPVPGADRVHGAVYADDLTALTPLRDGDAHLLTALAGVAGAALDSVARVHGAREGTENLRRWIAAESEIIGDSEAMERVLERIGEAAKTDAPVLVRGEAGSGKELVARAIHLNGRRAGAPFTAVHCGALAPVEVESELFGHEKDAFPGAVVRRKGVLEAAEGGTVFLDGIAELPPDSQARLARFLERRTIVRMGGTEEVALDVRVVAGSTRDLSGAAARGAFREDLLSSLGAIEIALPPLRDRRGDIPLLVRHFLDDLADRTGRRAEPNEPAMALLTNYEWPGNVRELRMALERAVLSAAGPDLTPDDFPMLLQARAGGPRTLEEVEREQVARVLRLVGGNQAEAARILGLSRAALQAMLARLGLGS